MDALPEETYADERILRHILTNLLSNAVKYSADGAPVQFSVIRLATRVVFKVVDRGIGIPEQDQKWIFQAFQRGRNVGNIPGTGLGLVIVKRCVELHRGTIHLESALGSGTKVEVEVPVALATLSPKLKNPIVLNA
jgi:signal transduction histidine kinase